MPAVTADPLTLPRIPKLAEQETVWRRVARIITAQRHLEGEGFVVRRPFPGVDLPRHQRWVPPRYQDINARDVALLSSDDGASLVRVIAGSLAGHDGPGITYTPITYLHATVAPGARLSLPWPRDFNALVYVLS